MFKKVASQALMNREELSSYREFLSDQRRLWKDLFADYDPSISAVYTLYTSDWINQTTKVHPPITTLTMTLRMMKLVDVVEAEEKVTFLFDYIAQYTDIRLTWNPLEYGGIDHIYVPQNSVWLPDIQIADAHEVKFFESDDSPKTAWVPFETEFSDETTNFKVYYNGSIGFYTATVASVICQLDVYRFPLDEHTCGVSVLFHSYWASEYIIKTKVEPLLKPFDELGNGEWKMVKIGLEEEETTNKAFGSVQRFVAVIKRNPGFYVALVMVPAFCINFLSIIALFLNVENIGEKITVGLTNIMAMTFILVILAADLPKTARIPLLAIYVIVGLVIVMASIGVVLSLPFLRKYQKKNIKTMRKRKQKEQDSPSSSIG
uniref:Neur_chan_LBD domain-containing protein n=1 Tax=Caenorhabditis tropicalis TaxID=1561998 RepID=A0A1I7TXM0_9PELO